MESPSASVASDIEARVGVGRGVDSRIDVDVGSGFGSGIDAGVDSGIDVDVGSGLGSGIDVGVDLGIDVDVSSGVGSGIGVGVDSGIDVDVGSGIGVGVGSESDIMNTTTTNVAMSPRNRDSVTAITGLDKFIQTSL